MKDIYFTIRAFNPGSPVYSVTVELPSGETCEVLEDKNRFIAAGFSIINSLDLYEWLSPMFDQFDPDDPYKYYSPYAIFQVIFDFDDGIPARQIFDYQDEIPFIDCWPVNLTECDGKG